MNKSISDRSLTQSLASQHGLRLGVLWLCSFACTMYAFETPFLGTLGNFLGIFSIMMGAQMIRRFRIFEHDLSWPQSLKFALTFFIYAALITTFGQYLYFAFLDKGHFLNIISTMMENPVYAEAMKQNFPELDTDKMLESLASMSSRDIIMQFSTMNLMATVVCVLLSSVFGGLGKVPSQANIKK